MNSLSYLSRQFDVLASTSTPTTPPSTPTGEPCLPFDNCDGSPQLRRIRTWTAARAFFFPTLEETRSRSARRVAPPPPSSRPRKRSGSIPNSLRFRPATIASASGPAADSTESAPVSTPPSVQTPNHTSPIQAKSLSLEFSWVRRTFIFRVLFLFTNWFSTLWEGLIHSLRHESQKSAVEADTSSDEKDSDDDLASALEAHFRVKEAGRASYVRARASSIVRYVLQPQTKPPTSSPLSQSTIAPPPTFNLIPPDPSATDDRRQASSSNAVSTSSPSPSTLSPPTPPRGHGTQSPTAPRSTPAKTAPLFTRKTLVLDLDETLIHSTTRPLFPSGGGSGLLNLGNLIGRNRKGGHMVEVVMGGRSTLYHVYKRPFVDYFLRKVSAWYTLVIFTASMKEYADPVIDWLDAGRGILALRFFREHCTQLPNGAYSKDLSVLNEDLARICLIDNSPVSYSINQANGIPIEGWTQDPNDEALLDLLPFLDSLRFTSDVRHVLSLRGF
ncbi:hypothetical protein EW145_g7619 [Phellinidium pouzarii]|uniref:FCP1 homology domain-containing protein n=1 Tax=Phellinidium pouzarii TaxID=167371 RepID=A0A4S4KHS9_9AGAM|nr:hypothetical protein EW145_g7619 [Phellinidium pouzarii]